MSQRDFTTDSRDERLVGQLLGRRPKISYRIVCRCPDGCPQVLETPPVVWENNRWVPFPTVFWLVCPRLKLEISRLEQGGYIKSLGQKAQENDMFRQEFQAGQEAIGVKRLQAAQELVGQQLGSEMQELLLHSTIAGSRHFWGIKCLHAHAAHFLATGANPIGRWTIELAGACRLETPCLSFLKTTNEEENL